ncbi:hypothetical protein DY000_02037958 [Brassica cretica]|uniref:Uncharacterized protein n=1 Tax=Brassica cretica TaxID=69181 RepID=A0ABQ7BKB7_BRACR|nr:hypothetical protein DY000_02037958 [Brassica cretica]
MIMGHSRCSRRDWGLGFGGDDDDGFTECKMEEFGKDEEETSVTTKSSGLTD